MTRLWRPFYESIVLAILAGNQPLLAKNSSELVYTEPFDLAAGGTTLTRASQEGIVFGNPALLPLGAATVRWTGFQFGLLLDRDLAKSSQGSGGEDEETDVADQMLNGSFHLGQTATLSFLNKNFAFTVFDRIEVDADGNRYADSGLPAIEFGAEVYGGGLISLATRPVRWFSIGMTAKYLVMGEPTLLVPIANQEKLQRFSEDPQAVKDELRYGKGMGADVGALFLAQGSTVDMSLGLKIEDFGATKIDNGQTTIPQTVNVGLGFAVHGGTDVLHLSLDYRDALNAYPDERKFKKIYAGARLMLRQRIGVALGLYQGLPTAGLRLDLFLLKLGITVYGRELGAYPGDKQRNLVTVYTSFGF